MTSSTRRLTLFLYGLALFSFGALTSFFFRFF
jgi:hypothetical protein